MQNKELFGLKGTMEMTIRRGNGDVDVFRKDNIIVDSGFDLIADALGNGASRPAVLSHVAVGSDGTAPDPTNTALLAEITRVAGTYGHVSSTKTFTITADFPAGTGTGGIEEAGVLNAATAGDLFDRVVFPVVNKGADDSMTITFTFTMS